MDGVKKNNKGVVLKFDKFLKMEKAINESDLFDQFII
jgi:hypothetical protein